LVCLAILSCVLFGTTVITQALDNSDKLPQKKLSLRAVIIPRGGGGSIRGEDLQSIHSQQQQQQQRTISPSTKSPFLLPLIDTKTVSLALRLTCETNRRLHSGTICSGRETVGDGDAEAVSNEAADIKTRSSHQQPPQGHGGQMVPSSMPPAISSVTKEERAEERRKEETTIFHSIEPWKKPMAGASSSSAAEEKEDTIRRGICRWGPDIDKFLETLLCSVGLANVDDDARDGNESSSSTEASSSSVLTTLSSPPHTTNSRNRSSSPMEDERQLILSLVILYLDHSISLDTPRHVDPRTGQPWCPPCPQILPRTVHRLVLTAFVIATKSLRGGGGGGDVSTSLLRDAANKLLGDETKNRVSEIDLEQMEEWMLYSLGADGSGAIGQWQVPAEEVQGFVRKWSETFYPQRIRAHDEKNQSRMERLERFWREKAGVFGGGGHHSHHHQQHYGQYNRGDHGHGHWNGDQNY
jgi:hypothetical protein